MKKKTLLLDIDECICNPAFLPIMNKYLGTNYSLSFFTDYYIDYVVPKEKLQGFYDELLKYDYYEESMVTWIPGAKTAIKKLSKEYDLYILTAVVLHSRPNECGHWFASKYNFIRRHFPFIEPNHIILTGAKNVFFADVQIDDRLQNMKGQVGKKLLFTAYHNKNITEQELKEQGATRVNNWKEILKLLMPE